MKKSKFNIYDDFGFGNYITPKGKKGKVMGVDSLIEEKFIPEGFDLGGNYLRNIDGDITSGFGKSIVKGFGGEDKNDDGLIDFVTPTKPTKKTKTAVATRLGVKYEPEQLGQGLEYFGRAVAISEKNMVKVGEQKIKRAKKDYERVLDTKIRGKKLEDVTIVGRKIRPSIIKKAGKLRTYLAKRRGAEFVQGQYASGGREPEGTVKTVKDIISEGYKRSNPTIKERSLSGEKKDEKDDAT